MKWSISLLIALIFVCSSCNSKTLFNDYTEFENHQWSVRDKVVYDVDIQDTVHATNLYLNFRHATFYPYSNIYVFLKTTFPNGQVFTDTIGHTLQENGAWRGDGAGDMWDNRILFNTFKFEKAGIYRFEIEQASRDTLLEGVLSVGLEIERYNEE